MENRNTSPARGGGGYTLSNPARLGQWVRGPVPEGQIRLLPDGCLLTAEWLACAVPCACCCYVVVISMLLLIVRMPY